MVFNRDKNNVLKYRVPRGFTLVELLVVISIIALLLAILMPSLGKARKQAQQVVCKTSLHQWALCYSLYANDWGGSFPEYVFPQGVFMESLRNYFNDVDKLRTCPSAKKVSTANPTGLEPLSFFGSTFTAWQIDPAAIWLDDDDWGLGSYTENSWIRKWSDPEKEWVKITSVKETSRVPILLDGRWPDSHVESQVPSRLTEELSFYNISNWWTIRTFIMRRHKDGINGVMVDMSVNHIRDEDMWSYKWHKTFRIRGDVKLRNEGLY